MHAPTALIAEDEPLLAAGLRAELERAWPALEIVASVGNGAAAVERALALRPEVLFLDIRMPGTSGLEAAQALAEDWPDAATFPLIVFVTAYDQYALQAFERAAVDYLLKPVEPARLAQTCARLQAALERRRQPAVESAEAVLQAALAQLRSVLTQAGPAAPPEAPPEAPPRLAVIQAGIGPVVHLVPIADVLYFEAADKYVRVVTAERDYLIRTGLRELLPQLDEQHFWQIHRGTVVRADAVVRACRDEAGKIRLSLRGHPDQLAVSRLYAHRFKAM